MPLTLSEHPGAGWVELTVSGRVTAADLASLLPRLDRFARDNAPARLVEVIAGFEGYDPDAVAPALLASCDHVATITHAAVVCDRGWLGPVSRALSSAAPLTLRSFTSHDRDAARAWAAGLI